MFTLLLCSGFVLLAADPPGDNTALADQVSKLVRSLDAPQLTQRDESERKLLELGPSVLPLLPPIGDRTSAETASRLTRVQQQLFRAQAVATAQPSLVTLKAKEMPLSAVLAEFAKQSGGQITDHREAMGQEKTDPQLEVDFDKIPFWRALDQVLDRAGLTVYPFSGERGLFVINRGPDAAPRGGQATYSGAFRLDPQRFEAVRELRNSKMKFLKLFLEVSWEPRLQPFAIMQPLATLSATGSDGQNIAVGNAGAEPEAVVPEGTSAVELEVPLELPPRETQSIRTLKGKLIALVPGAWEDFRFPGLVGGKKGSRPAEQRKAGATVSIEQLRKNDAIWEISLRVKYDAPGAALESHRGWVLDNQAYFLTANNDRVDPGGLEQTSQDRNEVGINYFFDLDDDPQKLTFVYRTPITVLEIPIEYEFHDLPLP